MTSPIGHLDYQAYPAWVTASLAPANPNAAPVGITQLYAGPISHFASVYVLMAPTGCQGRCLITWFNDAAFTQQIDQQNIRISPTATLNAFFPVRAPYVTVAFNNTSAGAGTVTVAVAGSNIQCQGVVFAGLATNNRRINQSVAAGVTLTLNIAGVQSGHGYICIDPPDNAAKVTYQLVTTDEFGVTNGILADFGAPAAEVSRSLIIPNEPLAIIAHNTDVVAHGVTIMLVVVSKP